MEQMPRLVRKSEHDDCGEALMTLRIELLALAACLAAVLAGCSSAEATPVEVPAAAATASEASVPTASPNADATSTPVPAGPAPLAVRVEAFENGGAIPDRYTCVGANDSPALSWSGVPEAAQALVLIVYDADAGAALGAGNDLGFLHWMVYDIPPTAVGLPLAATGDSGLPASAIETANDFFSAAGARFPGGAVIRGAGYDGPCPPAQHTYVFRLIALNEPLGLPGGTPYQTVMSALEGRVLAVADWAGVYPPTK
jgi:hypothetical protein